VSIKSGNDANAGINPMNGKWRILQAVKL